MSTAAVALIGPVLRPWTPFGGVCWKCQDGFAWAVPLDPINQLCWPCHDAMVEDERARVLASCRAGAEFEIRRLDHLVTCGSCADVAAKSGRIPPSYRCPALGRLDREAVAS